MDHSRAYKSFINSHYLSQGLRMTFGITAPAILFGYFNNLSSGLVISVGALCVGLTDNPGPIHHRRNAMLLCSGLIFIVSLITGFVAPQPILLGIVVCIFCFVFSMIGLFGSRASSVGLACLLVMVLNTQKHLEGKDLFTNSFFILGGGLWYSALSLLLYGFRPYKLTQQALGECIQSVAGYLRAKGLFYKEDENISGVYDQLLEKQAAVHQQEDLVRDLLFRGREMTKESTDTGRILVMIYLDVTELFERIITSNQNYSLLQKTFSGTGILEKFQQLINRMADELDLTGINVKSGTALEDDGELLKATEDLKLYFEEFRDQNRTAENVESFLVLRQVLLILENTSERIRILQSYTGYDRRLGRKFDPRLDYASLTSHEEINIKLLWDNLSLESNTFRHAIRLSVATVLAYVVSKFLEGGHTYWLMITTIVILKPAYSLTYRRNYERLLGTIGGALIGLLIIYLTKDKTVLFGCMVVFMIGTYTFIRSRYLVGVVFMTPYILLLFHLLSPGDFRQVLVDRIMDTAIGSGIAFIANLVLLPVWEHEQISFYMITLLQKSSQWFEQAARVFTGKTFSPTIYRNSRKESMVALANLSEAFSRMLQEPKRKRGPVNMIHPFVVSSHMLASHIAALSYYTNTSNRVDGVEYFEPEVTGILMRLRSASELLQKQSRNMVIEQQPENSRLVEKLNTLLNNRKRELEHGITESQTRKELSAWKPVADQFIYISRIAEELEALSLKYVKANPTN